MRNGLSREKKECDWQQRQLTWHSMHRQVQGRQIQRVKEVIVLPLSHPLYCCHHSNMPGGDTREAASLTKTTENGSRDWKRENTGKKERKAERGRVMLGMTIGQHTRWEKADSPIRHTSLIHFQMYKPRGLKTLHRVQRNSIFVWWQ